MASYQPRRALSLITALFTRPPSKVPILVLAPPLPSPLPPLSSPSSHPLLHNLNPSGIVPILLRFTANSSTYRSMCAESGYVWCPSIGSLVVYLPPSSGSVTHFGVSDDSVRPFQPPIPTSMAFASSLVINRSMKSSIMLTAVHSISSLWVRARPLAYVSHGEHVVADFFRFFMGGV